MNRGLEVLLLTVGGALGTNARYWQAEWMKDWVDPRFPWAIFTINVSGSFAIGLLSIVLARWLPHHSARLFILVGFLGGYTTFSTFSFESHVLWERGQIKTALLYMSASLIAGFLAVILGVKLGTVIAGPETPATVLTATDDIRGIDE